MGERVEAVQNEHDADAFAQMPRVHPFQNADAERNAKRPAQQKRPKPRPIQGVTQLPDGSALRQQAKRDDQHRGLYGGYDMQPNPRRDEAECETADTRDKGG